MANLHCPTCHATLPPCPAGESPSCERCGPVTSEAVHPLELDPFADAPVAVVMAKPVAPAKPEVEAVVDDTHIRRRIRRPAVGIYIISLAAVATAVVGTAGVMLPVLLGRRPWGGELEGMTTTVAILGPLLAGKHTIAAIGAWEMYRLRGYWWAVIGATAALIPSDPFAVLFGLPLGLWALVALSDSNAKAAFARRNSGEE